MGEKWYKQAKQRPGRHDLTEAYRELRTIVETQGKPPIVLSGMSVYKARELTTVQTMTVNEWVIGYQVKPLDEHQGFYVRKAYAKLTGGHLHELSDDERSDIIMAIAEGALDQGLPTFAEFINTYTVAISQPFAVVFWHEGNPNIVTPSKKLLNDVFDPARYKNEKPEDN
jgi:hypothetical protein